jgi:hypothetical protein
MGRRGIPSILETRGFGDLPRRSSIVADPIGRTAALGDRRSRTDLRRRIPGGTPEAWVGGRPQHSDRYSLGGG